MSVFWRGKAPPTEARDTVRLPFGANRMTSYGSYANVDMSTVESSMQSIAVRATVDLIASLGSELPVDVYSGSGPDRRTLSTPPQILDPAGDGYGLADWAYQALLSWLLRGNLYGEVLEVRGGKPTQILLYHPDDVSAWMGSDGKTVWTLCGKQVDERRFLHRRVNPMPGRVQGLSPVGFHADQIGLSLTANQFGLQWFRDGAHPSGMLTNEESGINEATALTAKQRFMATLRGTREPVVMGKGWKYQAIQVTAEESQFLATQGYTEAQCARIFGPGFAEILGYESGSSMTYANVESKSTQLLVYSLNKWFSRLERLLSEMLPSTQYVRINRDALLQSTTLTRYQVHESALKNRWKTANEVRALEDLPPVEWGDEPNKTYYGDVPGSGDPLMPGDEPKPTGE